VVLTNLKIWGPIWRMGSISRNEIFSRGWPRLIAIGFRNGVLRPFAVSVDAVRKRVLCNQEFRTGGGSARALHPWLFGREA
jgi:hypothetical protein